MTKPIILKTKLQNYKKTFSCVTIQIPFYANRNRVKKHPFIVDKNSGDTSFIIVQTRPRGFSCIRRHLSPTCSYADGEKTTNIKILIYKCYYNNI